MMAPLLGQQAHFERHASSKSSANTNISIKVCNKCCRADPRPHSSTSSATPTARQSTTFLTTSRRPKPYSLASATVHLHTPDDKKGPSPLAPRTRSPPRTAPTPSPNHFHPAPTAPFAWTKLTQYSHIICGPCLELRACILSVRRGCAWSAPSFMHSFLARAAIAIRSPKL